MGIRKGPGGTGWASALENKRATSRSSGEFQAGRGLFGGLREFRLGCPEGPPGHRDLQQVQAGRSILWRGASWGQAVSRRPEVTSVYVVNSSRLPDSLSGPGHPGMY